MKKKKWRKIQSVHDDEHRKAITKNKEKRNQEAILREEMNSIREEQSVKTQHQDQTKRLR